MKLPMPEMKTKEVQPRVRAGSRGKAHQSEARSLIRSQMKPWMKSPWTKQKESQLRKMTWA